MEPSYLCVPCTKPSDVTCDLLYHREAINKVLLGAGLELCEDTRHAGGTRLAVTQFSYRAYHLWAQEDDLDEDEEGDYWRALKLSADLLTSHHCFTSLELYSTDCFTFQVQEALTLSCTLKSLTVYLLYVNSWGTGYYSNVFWLVKTLQSLEELVFKTMIEPCCSLDNCDSEGLLPQALRNLTTLDVRNLEMSPQYGHQFVWALIESTTVAELAVGDCVYRSGPYGEPGKLFAQYLTKTSATLKKLTLSDGFVCDNIVLWMTLIAALWKTTTLEALTLEVTIGHGIFTEVSALFAEVVLRCPALRVLMLPWPEHCYREQFLNGCPVSRYGVEQWMVPWLTAIRTSGLHQLGIYLPGMDKVQCRTLLQAVADNKTLMNMELDEVPLIMNNSTDSNNLMFLSKTIQDLSLGDRVRLMNLYVTFENAPKILASAELPTVNFDNLCIDFTEERDLDPILACGEALSRRGTVTIITIYCTLMRQPAFGALLDWLAQSSTLTHMKVVACKHGGTERLCGCCDDMYHSVVEALSKNANIASIGLYGVSVQSKHLHMLLRCARKHRNLIEISLDAACKDADTWNLCSSSGMNVYVTVMRKLQKIMLRNAARISAAAMFVLGEDTRKGARLIESLHDHPRLLELVRKGACASEAEAQAMAQRAMRSVQSCSLCDYMTLTGVVKENVERLDPDSKEVHLVDLPNDCWLHVRRYLKIAHVVMPRPVEDWEWPSESVPPLASLF